MVKFSKQGHTRRLIYNLHHHPSQMTLPGWFISGHSILVITIPYQTALISGHSKALPIFENLFPIDSW